jgi:hypothetical protein
MKPPVIFAKHIALLFMISLTVNAGCAASLKQQPTIVRPDCSIAWDKTHDPKVTGYQLTVIAQSNQAKKAVHFILIHTTRISCKDAGIEHEGLWDVKMQSCSDTTTCGAPSEVVSIHIKAK